MVLVYNVYNIIILLSVGVVVLLFFGAFFCGSFFVAGSILWVVLFLVAVIF